MSRHETQTPPSLLIVGLKKPDYNRHCQYHECCGEYIRPGMVVQFKHVEFRNKKGIMEDAVEVWCRIEAGGRPPSPSAPNCIPRCKVGWLERSVSLQIGRRLNGNCGVVHKLLEDGDLPERRISNQKNGAARIFLVAAVPSGDEGPSSPGAKRKR